MISVSSTALRAGCGLLAASSLAACLAGCVSTEQKAAWLHIQDARIITSQSPTVVRQGSRQVRVEAISLLRHGGSAAVAVRLRNLSGHTLSDLPISVGILAPSHRRIYLNRADNLDYFQAHVALLPPGGTVTWVFASRLRQVPAGKAFALVGRRSIPSLRLGTRAPEVKARLIGNDRGRLQLRVTNWSSVPQPDLQLYAVTPAGGRITAAGSRTVAELGGGQSVTRRLNLVGHPIGSPQLEVLPTMFLP